MSRADCRFGYSQARLQARLGARPTAMDWQRLRATRELDGLLRSAAGTSLEPWTTQLGARAAAHDYERRLREAWRATVDEVAGWQPRPWRDAVAWLRWLPSLAALEKLARGGRAQEWMRGDAALAVLVTQEPRARATALRRTELAPLADGFLAPAQVTTAWVAHWRSLWPRDPASAAALERIVRDVARHRRRLEELPQSASSDDANADLARRLLVTLRRNPLSPAAAVAFLGLAALDMLQLRGAVTVRALRRQAAEPA